MEKLTNSLSSIHIYKMYISIIITMILLIITPIAAFATGIRGDSDEDATDVFIVNLPATNHV
jgi:hypothetical protein